LANESEAVAKLHDYHALAIEGYSSKTLDLDQLIVINQRIAFADKYKSQQVEKGIAQEVVGELDRSDLVNAIDNLDFDKNREIFDTAVEALTQITQDSEQ